MFFWNLPGANELNGSFHIDNDVSEVRTHTSIQQSGRSVISSMLGDWSSPRQECITYNGRYRKTSSISRTKSQNLHVSNLLLQLSLLNPLKPGVKSRMKV